MSLVIIDADGLQYKACWALQRSSYTLHNKEAHEKGEDSFIKKFESHADMKKFIKGLGKKLEDFHVEKQTAKVELYNVKAMVDSLFRDIMRATEATQYIMYLSARPNFRHKIAVTQPYKDRKNPKPEHFEEIGEYLKEKYGALIPGDLEADDAMGVLAKDCTKSGLPFVIVTIDKDINQIPGLHYNPDKKIMFNVSRKEAMRVFFTQVLMGDATDTIPGLPGIGEKTAEKMIKGCLSFSDYVKVVREEYRKAIGPGWKDYLYEQSNLVYIRTEPEEDINLCQ